MVMQRKNGELYIESVPLSELAARYGTPLYVYSKKKLKEQWHLFSRARELGIHLHYAVKANSQLHLLKTLNDWGSGFDIVSGGELARVLKAGASGSQIIFSGVGKTETEILSALEANIDCFNVESISELHRLQRLAAHAQKNPNIALRWNPDIDAGTHDYISTGKSENKFGLSEEEILQLAESFSLVFPNLKWVGVSAHIGSQIISLDPFQQLSEKMKVLYFKLIERNIQITRINLGGGLGVAYQSEQPPAIADYIQSIFTPWKNMPVQLSLEPGRILVAEAGMLLTQLQYIKSAGGKNIAIVDAGMNDLLRPALYEAWHSIIPIALHEDQAPLYFDIAGPVCESSDYLGKDRMLSIREGDLLLIECAGAYGSSMSSNYNSRPLLPEVWVDGSEVFLARERQALAELFEHEYSM